MYREKAELEREFMERREKDKTRFAELTEGLDTNGIIDPLRLPVEIWGNTYWEFMEAKKRDELLTAMFRHTLQRGMATMPIYQKSKSYELVKHHEINTLTDINKVPILLKDTDPTTGVQGFRSFVGKDPNVLRPTDVKSSVPYDSGGTKGTSTPTHITEYDLQIEGLALAYRCFLSGGFQQGINFYNFYNPTHKGGRLIEDAAKLIGKNHIMTRRPEDDLDACVSKIKSYKTEMIAAVQPPMTGDANMKKGSGVSFINLFGTDHTLFGNKEGSIVKRAFLTGFKIPEPVIKLSEDIGMDLFTTWGASEALPGCTSTVLGPSTRKCKYNNQHLIMGPHLLSVVKYEDGTVIPAKVGEDGILLVTTIARQGTLFFNYAIGDKAKVISNECDCGRTTPIIGNIRRVDSPAELISGGCRYC